MIFTVVAERLPLETAAGLMAAIALLSVVAVRLWVLRSPLYASRKNPFESATYDYPTRIGDGLPLAQ